MKICWNNLEKLEYRPDRGEWQKGKNTFYMYKDSCKYCEESFLGHKQSKGEFCDRKCNKLGKKHSEETKKKMSKAHTGKIISDKTRKKMSEIMKKRLRNPENNPSFKGGYHIKNIPMYDTYAHQISFCEDVRRNKKDLNILEVKCAYCGKWYTPTLQNIKHRIKALNSKMSNGTEMRFYCSTQCKQECPIYRKIKYQVGHPDSNKSQHSREVQPELRQMCFERDVFTCQICGKTQYELEVGLHCHHLEGIRQNPLESADLDMVIALCKTCHKKVHTLPGCKYNDLRCK